MRLRSLAITILLILVLSTAARAEQPTARTVSTSGDATVYVTPDEVIVTLGVEVFEENLDTAKTRNETQARTLIKAIKGLGVDEKQIQTDNLRVEIQYKDNRAWEGVRGYVVRRVYVVTLKDIKLFEKLIDAAVKNGANQLMGFMFRSTELRKYRDQARSMAIKAAREKAVALAKDLECGVGKPWQISENYGGGWGNSQYGVLAAWNAQNDVRDANAGEGESELLPLGKIAIRAQVSVVFDLTDK